MRNKYLLLLKLLLLGWVFGIFFVIFKHPTQSNEVDDASKKIGKGQHISTQIDVLENELAKQSTFYNMLLGKLQTLQTHQNKLISKYGSSNTIDKSKVHNLGFPEGTVLPVLIIGCNRDTAIKRSLDLLVKYRPNQERFPIIVSLDCAHPPTKEVVQEFGDKVKLIEHTDQSPIEVPLKEKKFRGYFLIARHYKWAFNQIFHKFNYEAVIVVEDDLDVSPDFFEYFATSYPLLKLDKTLWCISAWNDNGKQGLINTTKEGASLLYRTDFFPGLGWMFTKETWAELEPKWPKSYWDDWMRAAAQRKDRACVRPEVPRTRTFGKKGISNGLFFEKHLKFIHLNALYVEFSKMNLSYLLKTNYDSEFEKEVQRSQVVSLADVKAGKMDPGLSYRLIYHTKDVFKQIAKALGLMDDFKDGIPRTGYRGIVTLFYGNHRIYIAPNNNWRGYDPTWS